MENETKSQQLRAQQVRDLIDERISEMEQIALCHASAGSGRRLCSKKGGRRFFGRLLRRLAQNDEGDCHVGRSATSSQ